MYMIGLKAYIHKRRNEMFPYNQRRIQDDVFTKAQKFYLQKDSQSLNKGLVIENDLC